jgi:hypothetical protein
MLNERLKTRALSALLELGARRETRALILELTRARVTLFERRSRLTAHLAAQLKVATNLEIAALELRLELAQRELFELKAEAQSLTSRAL